MKTQIIKIENDWVDVKNACRVTVSKEHTDGEPSSEFKTKLLISQHSPIRLIKVNFLWQNIKSWISVHWSRHKFECFISTRRTDRTGIDRNKLYQDELVDFKGEINAQQMIDAWKVRLCHQADPETRAYAEDLKIELHKYEPELSDVLCPSCVYRGSCPEINNCGYFNKFKNHKMFDMSNINERYKAYNEFFLNRINGEK